MQQTRQGHNTAKRLIVVFIAAALLLSAALTAALLPGTRREIQTARAADVAPTVPTADYEFIIVKLGSQFTASCEKGGIGSITSENTITLLLSQLYTKVHTARGSSSAPPVIKITFQGATSGQPLDAGTGGTASVQFPYSLGLYQGGSHPTYILSGKITGAFASTTATIELGANVGPFYIVGDDTEILATGSGGNALQLLSPYTVVNMMGGKINSGSRYAVNNGAGEFNMYGGVVESYAYAIYTNSESNKSINIYGGTVRGNGLASSAIYFQNADNVLGTVNIDQISAEKPTLITSGGDLDATIAFLTKAAAATLNIKGGTVENTNAGTTAPAIRLNNAQVNITGGTVTTTNGRAIYSGGSGYDGAGTVKINGGTVTTTNGSAIYGYSQAGTVEIGGGTVEATGATGRAIHIRQQQVTIKKTGTNPTVVKSANTDAASGTIFIETSVSTLDIQGNTTVDNLAENGNVIYFSGTGTPTVTIAAPTAVTRLPRAQTAAERLP